jgi:hypothetical protein
MLSLRVFFQDRGRKNVPPATTVVSEPIPAQIVNAFCTDITYKHGGPREAARFIGLSGENAVQELQTIFRGENSPTEQQLKKMRLWLMSSTEEIRSMPEQSSP